MEDLAKSLFRVPWAISLFGVQQAANLISPGGREPTRKVEASLYSLAQSTQFQFDDMIWAAYQVGDKVQQNLVGLMWDLMTLKAISPSYLSGLGSTVTQHSMDSLRVMVPGRDSQVAWQELKNKYGVFNLVKHSHDLLQVPNEGDFPLEELIERAYQLGEYPDLWAIEGLGHDWGDHWWDSAQPVKNILNDERTANIPSGSLTMMHAGIGLTFAQRLMMTMTPYMQMSKIRSMLHEFVRMCDENSKPGYEGAAYESLGLFTRTWHPHMVKTVDEQLGEVAPEVVSYFWRGVGRAFYFSPAYLVPGTFSGWHSVDADPPHDLGRLNARAGLAWATTVVNIRHPQVMENLIRHKADLLSANDAFSNGLASSLVMSWDTTPGESFITTFCKYEPDPSDSKLVENWNRLVKGPAVAAVERYHPILKKHGVLGEIFHYQSLDLLTDQLERRRPAAAKSAS